MEVEDSSNNDHFMKEVREIDSELIHFFQNLTVE